MTALNAFIDFLNTVFWGYVLIYGLIAVGIFFTLRLGFIQIRHFPELFRSVIQAPASDASGITPFQALCTSLASRVGTGNLAGVAVALFLGGPGALFWMWVVAAVGMATAYSESALAQLYKITDHNGQYRGGPAFYISRGLNAPWAGAIFSVCLIIAFGLVFNAVQANSIADAMQGVFGVDKIWVGLALAALTAVVIFGGIRQIAQVAEYVVPFMAVAYLGMAVYVVIANITAVPGVIALIVKSAFGFEQAAGGVAGAMLNGVKRGLFSNEAGMGSAPNIAAVATPSPHHPASQGFVQALGVFIDTILICTATGIMILLSGVMTPGSELTGTPLTQEAMVAHIGERDATSSPSPSSSSPSSIIGNYAYSENAMVFLKLDNKGAIGVLRIAVLLMVIWGAYTTVAVVFNMADAAMGLMASVNLIAILLLSGTVAKLTKDYFEQKKTREPRFDPGAYPELKGKIEHSIWAGK
ncbi:sodium:alanine symporter family protein [Shinella sp.]|uniref:alanine/glycine:cation symporter family protein n=1 Tax=Shinella sp. TaxID=1870904 RepID=UPI0029A07788|nr:sodium:alanine symporter family protein [Shinella sp.]MDX3978504.1 sodium:alanine symporter family protein [Shinella sp.]